MKVGFALMLLILMLGLGVWFFVSGGGDVRNYPPKNTRIVAFGDSLVFGQGSTEGNDFVSRLSAKAERPIVNLGVSGNTTGDGVIRMDEVTKLDPGLVLLLLGGNDTLRRIPIGTTEANLRTLIESFQSHGAVVVLIGVRGGIFGSEREDMYEHVANEYGAVYVEDILDGILLKPELMHDGIHPNDQGYEKIAERLNEVLITYEL
jgi:acyl-CoA thioesterase I